MKSLLTLTLAACALASGAEVDTRQNNQQSRINQGVRSGQLTTREAIRLKQEEVQIHRTVQRQRARNGGTLTPHQRAAADRALDHQNARIAREKHDSQVAK